MTLKKHQEHRSAIEETFSQPEYSLAAQSDSSQNDRLYSRQKKHKHQTNLPWMLAHLAAMISLQVSSQNVTL